MDQREQKTCQSSFWALLREHYWRRAPHSHTHIHTHMNTVAIWLKCPLWSWVSEYLSQLEAGAEVDLAGRCESLDADFEVSWFGSTSGPQLPDWKCMVTSCCTLQSLCLPCHNRLFELPTIERELKTKHTNKTQQQQKHLFLLYSSYTHTPHCQ